MDRKPSKNEKAVLKVLELAHKAACKLTDKRHSPPYYSGIAYGHALEGVRTNGWEKATTIYDVVKKLSEYVDELIEHKKEIDAAVKLANKEILKITNSIMSKYKTCPQCKGEKGEKHPAQAGSGQRWGCWEDCRLCHGVGLVNKEARDD